jgi:hypothetical protein
MTDILLIIIAVLLFLTLVTAEGIRKELAKGRAE